MDTRDRTASPNMADEPPPLDFSDEDRSPAPPEDKEEELEYTPFREPVEEPAAEQAPPEQDKEPEPPKEQASQPPPLFGEEEDELFQDAASTERPHTDSEPPTLETMAPVPLHDEEPSAAASKPVLQLFGDDDHEEEEVVKSKPAAAAASPPEDLFDDDDDKPAAAAVAKPPPVESMVMEDDDDDDDDQGEDEEYDQFDMNISVSNPEKTGDGMGAYITYLVTTKTTLPSFANHESMVRRRFSDFLGLHMQLSERYMQLGRLVPPAPEKSVTGMTKVKFSKSEEGGALFVERRRASLERYMNRLAKHPVVRKDDLLQQFLENPTELPKAKDTSAVSGAGFMRLVKNVGDSISKIAGKKSDGDTWFEERESEYENLNAHLKKLHSAVDNMTNARKDLCSSTNGLVKGLATLGNVEENDSISRALSRLSEVEERVEALHQEQANRDLFVFAETVKDYIALLGALKTCFALRDKAYNAWQSTEKSLASKKETEQKLQTTGKTEKLPQVQQEIKDWEEKVKQAQKAFKSCTKTLRREIERFEKERVTEFKQKLRLYLDGLMGMQEELVRLWEGYLPDAKAIA